MMPAVPLVRTWQIAGAVLVLALFALGVYAVWPTLTGQADAGEREQPGGETDRRAQIQVVVVEPGDFVLRAEATGHLAPWRASELSSEGTGIVRDRPVEEGDFVREGDVLLQLDDRDQQIALSEAESDLLKAQTEYAALTSVRSAAPVDTVRAHEALVVYRAAIDPHANGSVTDAALDRARRDYEISLVRSGGRRDGGRGGRPIVEGDRVRTGRRRAGVARH
jgi:multidrug efflux pump subunit AcrA (membrane-fusion protein)